MNSSEVHLGTEFYIVERNIFIKNASAEEPLDEATHVPVIGLVVTYGFFALSACCFILWLGIRLYGYLQSVGSNTETTNGNSSNFDRAAHETSTCESSNSETPTDRATYAPSECSRVESIITYDSNELHTELNKLKPFCKGMPNKSCGNFSTPLTSLANTSVALSSDMDALWSSIDFDEFEESTIYANTTRKTHSEGCFSTLFSEASISVSDLINSNSVSSIEPYTRRCSSNFLHFSNPSADMVAQVLNFLREFVPRNRNMELPLKTPTAHEIENIQSSLRSWASASESVNVTNLPSTSECVHTKTYPSVSESEHPTKSPLTREFLKALSLRQSELSITSRIEMTTLNTSSPASKPTDEKNNLSFTKPQCFSTVCVSKPLGSKFSASYECVDLKAPCSQTVLSNENFKPSSLQNKRCKSVHFQETRDNTV